MYSIHVIEVVIDVIDAISKVTKYLSMTFLESMRRVVFSVVEYEYTSYHVFQLVKLIGQYTFLLKLY